MDSMLMTKAQPPDSARTAAATGRVSMHEKDGDGALWLRWERKGHAVIVSGFPSPGPGPVESCPRSCRSPISGSRTHSSSTGTPWRSRR